MLLNNEVRAVMFLNRVGNVHMEGSYGYVKKSLREDGFAMLTATSMVEEFAFDKLDKVDISASGKQWCFLGTDYYGREMTLPIQRIRGIDLKDTEEQGRLKGLNIMFKLLEDDVYNDPSIPNEYKDNIRAQFVNLQETREKLMVAGVTEYEPRRATEDEL